MIDSPSNTAKQHTCASPFSTVVSDNTSGRELFSESQISVFNKTLQNYGEVNFRDAKWVLKPIQSRRPITIDFTRVNFDECDINFIKAYIVTVIVQSPNMNLSTAKRELHNCITFFDFLYSTHVYISNVVSALMHKYVIHIGTLDCPPSTKNSICATAKKALRFAADYNLLRANLIAFDFQFDEGKKLPKRAPEYGVIKKLDRIFFDLATYVPLDMRLMYLLLRLILNRFSEVQNMHLECMVIPEEGIFSVSIPVQKATPLSLPIYISHSRLIDGNVENILFDTLLKQQQYARTNQANAMEYAKDYLFLSSKNPKELLTIDGFNKYLNDMCQKYNIRNHDGTIAHVTSHGFRHIGVTERFNSNLIMSHEIQKEAAHSRIEETLGYGYQSIYDETNRLEELTNYTLSSEFTHKEKCITPRKPLSSKRYDALLQQPYVRIIPAYGACCDMSCSPKYEQCITCDYFVPDNTFLPYFEECILILEEKLNRFYSNPHASKEAIQFNEERLALYKCFVASCAGNANRNEMIG
ncbi:hypothetical protein LJC04_04540 [Ruminococcaceae bacterium OttesenSCG-928-O06]|nr:hypothetical protein [Ruminococcaceae bacterium OttesenSCG-928-O06]